MNKKYLIICFSIIIVLSLLLIIFSRTSLKFIEHNYDHYIKYNDVGINYDIYQKNKKIVLYYKPQIVCTNAPCESINQIVIIDFSKDNMKVVNDFINELFESKKEKKITLNKDELTLKQKNIIEAIIHNDESLINVNNDEIYKLVTDMWCKTMLNDGGSHESSYYIFDFSKNKVEKYESYYRAYEGYDYKDRLIYTKEIDKETLSSIKNTLNTLLYKEDDKEDNLCPFSIIHNDEEKEIYNEESINKLNEIIFKLDGNNNKKELVFSLKSTNLKCLSPSLEVYNDNTYELFATIRDENDSLVTIKKGTYNYNLDLILNDNISNYLVDSDSAHILIDGDGKEYRLDVYEPLDTFLKSIDVNIDVCG